MRAWTRGVVLSALLGHAAMAPGVAVLVLGAYGLRDAPERLGHTACVPFAAGLRAHRPRVIVGDERLRRHYAGGRGYQSLVRDAGASGFRDLPVAGTSVHIHVRRAEAGVS